MHAGLLRDPLHAELVDAVHMDLADLGGGGGLAGRRRDQHVVGRHVEHRPYMQLRSCQRPFTHREDPRTALVGDPYELSGGAPARHTGEKIKPLSIFVGVHHPRRPAVRVHGQEQLAQLVPGLHQNERRTRL
ncbi:hypothetical protein SAV14893_024220 [Streptomyces avermitilis]|uniref:Uncharacterized protein n=1 Tax=Streptomyces avermitilis TaxID=33903 RepID=A0A4D4LYE6_STRAX|nr:hypothetical protein SAV14893_024220 [Streptomyces avermitilis]